MKFVGTADIGLAAPTAGAQPGFIFFGDKNNPPTDFHSIRGTSLGGYNGKMYFPKAKVDMGGTANGMFGSSDCTIIVAEKFEFGGTPNFEAAGACSAYGGSSTGGVAKIVR